MDMSKLGGLMKHPAVLIGGLVVGIILLLAVSRSKSSGSSGADMTAASMATSAATTVQLAGFTTDYNKAALGYQASLAQTAANNHSTDVNARTAVELQSVSMMDNIARVAGQMGLIHEQGATSLALQSGNNDTLLKMENAKNAFMVTMAPHSEALARIGTEGEVARAKINADASTTIANINAATQISLANRQIAGQATKGLFDNLPFFGDMMKSLPGFGGSGGATPAGGDASGSGDMMQTAATAASMFAAFA